ncbi:MAG: ABC transporter permease subunit [Ramlibacter sp.]
MSANTSVRPELVEGLAKASTPPGPLREFWISFSRNHGAVGGMVVVAVLLLLALFAPWVAPHLPDQTNSAAFLKPPVWQAGGSSQFLLGTDAIGRDILSRLIWGARLSLSIGLGVVALSVIVGIALGLIAGFARGIVEIAIMRLMFTEVLPNCAAPLIVQASLGISTAILDAAALGFLGLGAQPPSPEWGTMLADAREFVLRAWWVVTFPGLMILVAVLAFNLMGDGLRDALDPKLKR